VSFYSRWQPLLDEDRHTALVFGFLRHAPVALALGPWLEQVLDRKVKPTALQPSSFWPNLPSVVEGSEWTEPELVFDADDGQTLKVIVEVKPGYDMHLLAQISREVIDVAKTSGVKRIAIVMVGADLGRPGNTRDWGDRIADAAAATGLNVDTEVHYSSFALLGDVVIAAGQSDVEWEAYATDVIAQLKRKGLLRHGGAPMIDDLQGMTLWNAVEAFNRVAKATRHFYLQLQSHSAFTAIGLQPDLSGGYVNSRILRNGKSGVITQREEW